IPIAGWIQGWRRERLQKALTGTRPEVPRLRPEFDPFEERSFLGLDFTSAVQVALVGAGAVLVRELFANTDRAVITPASPVPSHGPQADAEEGPLFQTPQGWGVGDDAPRYWAGPSLSLEDAPAEMVTRLDSATEAESSSEPGNLPDGPGVDDPVASPVRGGGG